MKLTSLARMLSAAAAVGMLSTVVASAGVIRGPVHSNSHVKPAIYLMGYKHNTTCPSQYYECVEISRTSPATQEWCIIYSGTSDCTDLYPGTWTWTPTTEKAKNGHPTKKISASFSPNPGNPTTLTISTKAKKSTKGKIKYAVSFTVCNSASSCLGPVLIGVSID